MQKYYNFKYKEEYQYPRSAMLNLTDNCNLACRYCFVEQHPHDMPLQVAKDTIDYLYKNIQYLKEKNLLQDVIHPDENGSIRYHINFFGGEPLLRYNQVIVPLIEYIEKTYPDTFEFGITTNVTLLDKEKVDFFVKHKVGILTSIDGAEETQCYNRPCRNGDNSFKLVEQNIKYYLEKYPTGCFRSTGYAPTIQYLFKNYLYAESLGFKNYAIVLNERDEWTEEQKAILQDQIYKIQFYRFKQKINGVLPMNCLQLELTNDGFPNLFNSDCENINTNDDVLRCGLGTLSCAVGWDGKIYGCQQDVSLDDKNIFYIGDIYNGIDVEKHFKLLSKYYEDINTPILDKCKNCLLQKTCYGNKNGCCPSTNMSLFGDTHKNSDIRCFFHQLIFKTSLLTNGIMTQLNTQNNFIEGTMKKEDEIEKRTDT